MLTRITIDLPQPLAEVIDQLAIEHLRPPKQQILWLLREAIRSTGGHPLTPQPQSEVPHHVRD